MRLAWFALIFVLACDDGSEGRGDPPPARALAGLGSRNNFVGTFEPQTATWRLRMQRPGWVEPDREQTFVFGAPGDTPVVGNWEGGRLQTPGTFRDGAWSLSFVLGGAERLNFRFGQPGDEPVVGDWDGDGNETVGVYRSGTFLLRNNNSEGPEDVTITLGEPGDLPVAGDWNGDGTDTVGVYKRASGEFVLLDEAERTTTIALGVSNGDPVVGDWDGNQRDTVGIHLGSEWLFANDHRDWLDRDRKRPPFGADAEIYGEGELMITFGAADATPISGNWDPGAPSFAPAPAELQQFFPLAADFQGPETFASWRDAGINTVIRVRSGADPNPPDAREIEDWTAKANELGLKMIREPRSDPRADNDEANLLAWILLDEPEVPKPTWLFEDPFAYVQRRTDSVRAEGVRRRPSFVNFAGYSVLRQNDTYSLYGPGDRNPIDFYSRYLALVDWAAQDLYPLSQMYADPARMTVTNAMATLPLTIDKLRRWSPDKPQFAFIETTQHSPADQEMTPALLRAQVWLAIVHGVRGIFYFPHDDCRGQCFDPDGTPDDVKREMRALNAQISALAPVLQGQINPTSFGVSAADLELGWRYGDVLGNYIFAVNASPRSVERWIRVEGLRVNELTEGERVLDVVDGYAFHDHFGPWGVRVYKVR